MENNSIVEEIISIITESESIIVGSDLESSHSPSKSVAKFSDGLSFVNAFKAEEESQKATTTSSPLPSDQKWQIWYWKSYIKNGKKNGNWQDFLRMKSSFTTREQFWQSYNDINGYEFGLLSSHCDYCVFKEGIKPMWEDQANRNGGRWLMEFPRKKDWKSMSYLDEIWLKVLLAITGDDLIDYRDEVCGAVLIIRSRINKIAVWTANSDKILTNLKICEILKACTGLKGKMYYEAHYSCLKKSKSNDAKYRKR